MSAVESPRAVLEAEGGAEVPLWPHPEWAQRFPWLVQGTTGAGSAEHPFDLGLSGAAPVGEALDRWRALLRETGMVTVVHSRQVHGADLLAHAGGCAPGILVTDGVDGHLTGSTGLLLAVSVADCVPVSIVDAKRRAVAMVHAGWRGTAAGVAERAVEALGQGHGSRAADLWVHCGPAICGECYEVGPEVHRGVHPDREPPATPTPIDLRAAIAQRVVRLGVDPDRVTVSGHCTRCGPGGFFSHRGGSPERQMGVLGVRG